MKGKSSLHSLTALCLTVVIWCTYVFPDRAQAQQPAPGQVINPLSLAWPRYFAAAGYEYAVYQPQIDAWPGNQLSGRYAMATRPAGTSSETYGVVFFTARTEIHKATRLVTLADF